MLHRKFPSRNIIYKVVPTQLLRLNTQYFVAGPKQIFANVVCFSSLLHFSPTTLYIFFHSLYFFFFHFWITYAHVQFVCECDASQKIGTSKI